MSEIDEKLNDISLRRGGDDDIRYCLSITMERQVTIDMLRTKYKRLQAELEKPERSDTEANELIDKLQAELEQVQQESARRLKQLHEYQVCCLKTEEELEQARKPDVCSVCAGEGKPVSGKPCVCDGRGTIYGEMEGLRKELEQAQKNENEIRAHEKMRCAALICNAYNTPLEIADMLQREAQSLSLLDPKLICGCGKPVRYELPEELGRWSCNKRIRCNSPQEPHCEYCNGEGMIEGDNNSPIIPCPACKEPLAEHPLNLQWGENVRNGETHTEWHAPCGCAYHPEPFPHVHPCSDEHKRPDLHLQEPSDES